MTLTPQLAQQCLELIDFLHGSAPLDGVWFGDKHPTERGAFWWRKRLSALREALASGEGDETRDERAAVDVLGQSLALEHAVYLPRATVEDLVRRIAAAMKGNGK